MLSDINNLVKCCAVKFEQRHSENNLLYLPSVTRLLMLSVSSSSQLVMFNSGLENCDKIQQRTRKFTDYCNRSVFQRAQKNVVFK